MALPVKTGLPFDLVLSGGYVLRFDAVDPTSGATVSGVKVSNASVFCDKGTIALKPAGAFEYAYQASDGSSVGA